VSRIHDSLDNDRGASVLGDVKGKSSPGSKVFGLVVLLFIVGLALFMAYRILSHEQSDTSSAASVVEAGIRNQLPDLRHFAAPLPVDPPPIVPETPPTPPPVVVNPPNIDLSAIGTPEKTMAQLLRERRLSSELTGESESGINPISAGLSGLGNMAGGTDPVLQSALARLEAFNNGQMQGGNGLGDLFAGSLDDSPSLNERLSPVHLNAVSAQQIGSMDLLLLQTTMIDCVLNTRIDSTVPGMISCDATRDVYSSNGRTVLLDRGTRFTGRYEQGVTRAQPRIFVVWERAVTPQGVLIPLDSPSSDTLGGAGLSGKVNYHFWRRFGAATLITVMEDAGDYMVNRGNQSQSETHINNTTRSASSNAAIVLQDSANIPPTLTKRHGERITIFVARDLDFGGIYELRSSH